MQHGSFISIYEFVNDESTSLSANGICVRELTMDAHAMVGGTEELKNRNNAWLKLNQLF